MAHFEATVRLFDIVEPDTVSARRAVDERLRAAGFTRWQIASIGLQGTTTRAPRVSRRPMRADVSYAGGGLLVAAVVAWTLWFLWLLAG